MLLLLLLLLLLLQLGARVGVAEDENSVAENDLRIRELGK
jgi:hypothetical protein